MPLKTEPLEEPGLILTPVIDIMFLLLIFFMVGSQFTEDEGEVPINLPTASETASLTGQPDPATVNVTADGQVYLQGDSIALPDLERRLGEMCQNFPGLTVLIRGDGSTAYQQVMDVLATAKRAGVRGVSLAHRPRQEQ